MEEPERICDKAMEGVEPEARRDCVEEPGQLDQTVEAAGSADVPGAVIGQYKLLEKIGEGGNGIVWAVEQRRPVKRRVALKILKLGMDTKQVVARFEAERQALALMDHPNIAKVLDAGATETGRPYFVMELVRGIPITDYCDRERLSTKKQLDLFIQVCHAIQHAHQKGIIHRDVKPSNILVTIQDGVPVPKVIDFGIAKATQQDLTEKTVYTRLQQFVGTPAYMSPEQAEMSGLDVDTRSDIYSLGVLLYELLTGTTPFDTQELIRGGIDAMRKAIREKEPDKPSTRVNQTVAAQARSPQRAVRSAPVATDLDWIVMKCLEKDRTRRYETANALAADVTRHLNHEPVMARPPSRLYRLRKMVRRNRGATVAVAGVVIALAAGLSVATAALVRERQARQRELAQSVRADAVADFFDSLMLETLPSLLREGNMRGARALMDEADRLASTSLANAPAAELHLRVRLCRAFHDNLTDWAAAARQAEIIAQLLPNVTDAQLKVPRDLLRIEVATARLLAASQDAAQQRALKALDDLYTEFMGRLPPARVWAAICLNARSLWLRFNAQAPEEALAFAAEASELISGVEASDAWGQRWAYRIQANCVGTLSELGGFGRAERIAREGLGAPLASDPEIRSGQLDLAAALSAALCGQDRIAEAVALLQEQRQTLAAGVGSEQELVQLDARRGEILARSGNGRAALPILEAVAASRFSDPDYWRQAAVVAAGIGDREAHRRLSRIASLRFVATADGMAAAGVAWGLNQLPTDDATLAVTRAMLERVAQSSDEISTAFSAIIGAVLAYREQRYNEALLLLDQFQSENPGRKQWVERYVRLPGQQASCSFLRAMIYAQLGLEEEARDEYADGEESLKKSPGGPPGHDRGAEWDRSYQAEARQREARELFQAKGIPLPEPDTK